MAGIIHSYSLNSTKEHPMNYGDKIATEIVESIIKALETGVDGNWSVPWTKLGQTHKNAFTGRAYRGFNPIWLSYVATSKGYSSIHWATFNAWKKAGHMIKKGTKTTPVCFWNFDEKIVINNDGTESKRSSAFFKVYNLINADCVEGWEEPTIELNPFTPIQHCEKTVNATTADIRHGGDRAFFVPSADYIQMPTPGQFSASETYYATLFHELTHWTGSKARLDREFGKRFGDNAYAFEELVAELGAAMLCAQHGIESITRKSHAQYIKHWIETLKADPKALWTAGSKAQQAVDYIVEMKEHEQAEAA